MQSKMPKKRKRFIIGEESTFFATVEGGEGSKCHYPTRLDTYGCGCAHDCKYCYAKSLLNFRGFWHPLNPKVANIQEMEKIIAKLPKDTIVRIGGMTDCFQPVELKYRATLNAIKLLNKYRIGYLIVTKSDLVANDEYVEALDKDLAHIQITVTTLDDNLSSAYEKAPVPSKRVEAILKLQRLGYDVAIRLSPIIPEFMDFDKLNSLGIEKAIVEFLRVNAWIKKWFKIDYSKHTLWEGGYQHLPLEEKKKIIAKIHIPNMSVCEDVQGHYDYWKYCFNPNKEYCCNLRKGEIK